LKPDPATLSPNKCQLGEFTEYADHLETVDDNIDMVIRKEEVSACGAGMEKYGVEKLEGEPANRYNLMGR
jgi:hypothetical protein